MTKVKNGFKCDECGIIENEPEFTVLRYGYPEIDALHFCSRHCLAKWAIKEGGEE